MLQSSELEQPQQPGQLALKNPIALLDANKPTSFMPMPIAAC